MVYMYSANIQTLSHYNKRHDMKDRLVFNTMTEDYENTESFCSFAFWNFLNPIFRNSKWKKVSKTKL